jgi:hypothetical protein
MASSVISIERYDDCDVYIRDNSVEWYGFDSETSFGVILDKALANKCSAITKNGGGKWYLKGEGKTYSEVTEKAKEQQGKHARRKTWVIRIEE